MEKTKEEEKNENENKLNNIWKMYFFVAKCGDDDVVKRETNNQDDREKSLAGCFVDVTK